MFRTSKRNLDKERLIAAYSGLVSELGLVARRNGWDHTLNCVPEELLEKYPDCDKLNFNAWDDSTPLIEVTEGALQFVFREVYLSLVLDAKSQKWIVSNFEVTLAAPGTHNDKSTKWFMERYGKIMPFGGESSNASLSYFWTIKDAMGLIALFSEYDRWASEQIPPYPTVFNLPK